ncbi:hypothetical protein U9M48_000949 [Paspalum notatum var. saurae]|uniref:BPM/SPOP BACK domain-containing protein n=1 Tax=Paspalum notatum var. saurae TaxID=547442 RepID=A0AAQ3SII9_PASNO
MRGAVCGMPTFSLGSTTTFSLALFSTTTFKSWSYNKFVKRKDVEESTYVKDDCLRRCDIAVAIMAAPSVRAEAGTQFVVVPPRDMRRQFGRLLSSAEGRDVTFERSPESSSPRTDEGDDEFVLTQHLLVAADRYDLERLKLICEQKLCCDMDASTVATALALAEQLGCRGLNKACFKLLKSPSQLKTAMATEGFDHLMSSCPSLIKELLAKIAGCP